MNPKLKSLIQLVLFSILGITILFFLYHNLDIAYQKECQFKNIPEGECSLVARILSDFRSVNILWIIIICILFMLSNVLRAIRWNQLLETLNYKPTLINAVGTIMIAYLANMALPRIGEVVRAGSLSKYENIPVSKIFGTVVLDRILDVISLLLVIGIALILSFNTFSSYFAEHFQMPQQNLFIIIGILLLAGILGLFIIKKLFESENIDNAFINRLKLILKGFKDGLLSVRKVKNIPLLIFNSVGIWTIYYLMTYLCFFSFAPTEHLSPVAGLVVFIFGTLGMVLPSPGGMGSYQWLVSQALIIYGIDKFDAFSFSNIIFFAIQIFCNILFGFFFLIFLPQYNLRRKSSN